MKTRFFMLSNDNKKPNAMDTDLLTANTAGKLINIHKK